MESPFRKRFDTNYVPTDAEIGRIRVHLVPHEAELARLDSLIHDLTVQRDRLKDHIDAHKALISHPRRLPQDVVEQIFLACLPTRHNAIMCPTQAPLLLGRICRAWRTITLAMPRLWRSLHISVEYVFHKEERKAAFVDWLKRSAVLPLAISAEGCSRGGIKPQAVIGLLIPFSPRWHALHIFNMQANDLLQLLELDAPQLADIRLTSRTRFGALRGPHVLSSNLFRGSNLRRVAIAAPDLEDLVPATPFTWSHLTDLTLEPYGDSADWTGRYLDSETAHRLLRPCSGGQDPAIPIESHVNWIGIVLAEDWERTVAPEQGLKGCANLRALKFPLHASPREAGNEPLLLPSLESLTIIDHNFHSNALNFVDQLVMSHLGHLGLCGNPSRGILTPDIIFIENLAYRSSTISDLSLELSDFTTTSLLTTLQLFPRLTKLRLVVWDSLSDDWDLEADAAPLLTILTPDVSPYPWPELKELITKSRWLEDDIWMNFLQKQLDYGTNLRRFTLEFQCETPEAIPDVRLFLTRGLDVALKYARIKKDPQPTPWQGAEC
ncbi:hypothetical protein B0H19DRAFT_1225814 [Mycena capillaripes]|nr:hypothetical protein B0H19DRAFT_1225814 [Mycena capillaripes]